MIKSVDKEKVKSAVADYVKWLRCKRPEVERVIWFVSWVTGLPVPSSDVDLCLVVASSEKSQREHMVDYLPIGFPTGIDLLVYTREEFDSLKSVSPGLFEAIQAGIEI